MLLATLGLVGLRRPARRGRGDWTVEPAANSFGADRQDYRYTINPGGQVEDGIVVVNHGTAPLQLALRATDRVRLGARCDRPDDVTVAPGESVEVPFALTLPDDAAPGDYVGGIVAARWAAGRIPIRLRVGGALKPSLAVEDVHVRTSPVGKGDATVTYTIHNTGNAILSARQAVSVSGPFGRWAATRGQARRLAAAAAG